MVCALLGLDCTIYMGATDVLTDTVPFGSTTLDGAGDGRVPVPPYAAWWLVRRGLPRLLWLLR